MRRIACLTLLLFALAGCAPTAVRSPDGDAGTNTVAAVVAPPVAGYVIEAPADAPVAEPMRRLRQPPFDPIVEADLERLPDPAPDLWTRIVAGYQVPDIEGPLVTKWEQWYSERPDYVARMVDRSRRYLYHVVTEVHDRGMPLDVALLPMVESAFNPVALSTSRASGIWQFIPSTGKHYGLQQNFWFDSRRDVIAATDKALDYLQKLYGDFNDWQLALAAYNWGEGNVAKAIARNQARGLPTDYASLTMPDETRNYLPKLQAIKNIVRDPGKYGLVLADIPDTPYFAVVKIDRRMDVKVAAELAEMPMEEFVALNPQHNRPVIAGASDLSVLLPIDRAELFAAKLELHDQPLVSWQAYRFRAGDTLPQIAQRYGLSVDTLRAVNGIGPRARIPVGHTLLVPAERPSQAAVESLANAVFTTVPQGRTFYHRVNRGDTLQSIASRYGVTAADLRQWNGMTQNYVRVGQQIRVNSDVVPVKPGVAPKSPATTRTAKGSPAKSNAPATPAARTGNGKVSTQAAGAAKRTTAARSSGAGPAGKTVTRVKDPN